MVSDQLSVVSTEEISVDERCERSEQQKDLSLFTDLKNDLLKLAKCPFRNNLVGKLQNIPVNDQRDNAVSSLRCLNRFYNFSSQTFATAVQYLDFVLSRVKVQNKYLSCLAAACYYISTKIHEEPEDIPSASELSQIHRQIWKASDLKRMELVVLEKLSWKLWPVTCPTVLEHICNLLHMMDPSLPENMLSEMLYKFEVCINYTDCVVYSVPTLALCLVQLYLKQMSRLSPVVSQHLLKLHEICDISDSELYECYQTVTKILDNYTNKPSSHPSCLPLPKPQPRLCLVTKPSMYGDTDLPTIYENPITTIHVSSDSDDSPVIRKTYDSWSYCILPGRCSITAK